MGKCIGSYYTIEEKEDVKPYHVKPIQKPTIHEPTLRKEVDRSIIIGVLKKTNNSQWAAPTFIIPKINVGYSKIYLWLQTTK